MARAEQYDVLFRGGTVIDGTGAPRAGGESTREAA